MKDDCSAMFGALGQALYCVNKTSFLNHSLYFLTSVKFLPVSRLMDGKTVRTGAFRLWVAECFRVYLTFQPGASLQCAFCSPGVAAPTLTPRQGSLRFAAPSPVTVWSLDATPSKPGAAGRPWEFCCPG